MTPSRPALRVALVGAGAVVTGFAIIAGYLGWLAHRYEAARHRATSVVRGVVVEDGIGDNEDIRVRWVDRAGRAHVQRFGIYGTDRYTRGHVFAVAYDPGDPTPEGFPADSGETSTLDDLEVAIGFAGAVAGLLVAWWSVRGLAFRRALGRPGHPMTGWMFCPQVRDGWALFGGGPWLGLAEPGQDAPTHWQRVMWHPVLATTVDRVAVVVHGDPAGRRRVAVTLPDGSRLVPVGRFRRRPPRRFDMVERAEVRAAVDRFVLPAGTPPPSSRPWWRGGMVFGTVGVPAGIVLGFVAGGGGDAVLPFAAGVAAVLVNAWALGGNEP